MADEYDEVLDSPPTRRELRNQQQSKAFLDKLSDAFDDQYPDLAGMDDLVTSAAREIIDKKGMAAFQDQQAFIDECAARTRARIAQIVERHGDSDYGETVEAGPGGMGGPELPSRLGADDGGDDDAEYRHDVRVYGPMGADRRAWQRKAGLL